MLPAVLTLVARCQRQTLATSSRRLARLVDTPVQGGSVSAAPPSSGSSSASRSQVRQPRRRMLVSGRRAGTWGPTDKVVGHPRDAGHDEQQQLARHLVLKRSARINPSRTALRMYLMTQFYANPPSAVVAPANGRLARRLAAYGCALRPHGPPASLPSAAPVSPLYLCSGLPLLAAYFSSRASCVLCLFSPTVR